MSMIGHNAAWAQWRNALRSDRMHHAWMFAGRQGLGKMQFALKAALEMVGGADGTAEPQNHPDILVLTRAAKDDKEEKKRNEGKPFERKRNISVAQIRAMQTRLNTRPTMGEKRAVIVDPADDMEASASNALLKSLEEPPHGTYFLLIAHRPARLLPTIRSRCRIVRFPTLPNEEMIEFLARNTPDVDSATRDAAAIASHGSPGAALEFVDRDLGRMFTLMQAISRDGDPHQENRGKLADAIGARPNRERVLASIDLARAVVANALEGAAPDQYLALVDAHTELVRLTGQAPIYNFDTGLLLAEIGSLLASAATSTEPVDV